MACLDQTEINAENMPITALSTTRVTFTAPAIAWSQYVGRLGDTTPPTSAQLFYVVKNARTDAVVGRIPTPLTSGVTVPGQSDDISNLSAKTSYYLEVNVNSSSHEDIVFARRCFMTGGSYAMTVAPGTQGKSSGCFSISEQTGYNLSSAQHVRNCMCGRGSTLPRFNDAVANTAFLNALGCR